MDLSNRRTGRTTRALQGAAKLALDGRPVFYVVPLAVMADYVLDILRKLPDAPAKVERAKRTASYLGGGSVTVLACQREDDFERHTRGIDNPAFVVDHYFYEHRMRAANAIEERRLARLEVRAKGVA